MLYSSTRLSSPQGGGGGGGSPGGNINNVQLNDGAGGFAGSDNLTYDSLTGLVSIPGFVASDGTDYAGMSIYDAGMGSKYLSLGGNGTVPTYLNLQSGGGLVYNDIKGNFDLTGLTADRDYTFPDQSGTIALLSDIPTGNGVVFGDPAVGFDPGMVQYVDTDGNQYGDQAFSRDSIDNSTFIGREQNAGDALGAYYLGDLSAAFPTLNIGEGSYHILLNDATGNGAVSGVGDLSSTGFDNVGVISAFINANGDKSATVWDAPATAKIVDIIEDGNGINGMRAQLDKYRYVMSGTRYSTELFFSDEDEAFTLTGRYAFATDTVFDGSPTPGVDDVTIDANDSTATTDTTYTVIAVSNNSQFITVADVTGWNIGDTLEGVDTGNTGTILAINPNSGVFNILVDLAAGDLTGDTAVINTTLGGSPETITTWYTVGDGFLFTNGITDVGTSMDVSGVIDDVAPVIGSNTGHEIGNTWTADFSYGIGRGFNVDFNSGRFSLGDIDEVGNASYLSINDGQGSAFGIANLTGHITLQDGNESRLKVGSLPIPNLGFTIAGSFLEVSDPATSDQGVIGVGAPSSGGPSLTPQAILTFRSNAAGDVVSQVLDINGGGAFAGWSASTSGGTSMTMQMSDAAWQVFGTNLTGIAIDDTNNLIVFNPSSPNPYSFPFADGATGQVLQTDGAGVLSWENVTTTVGTLTPGSIPYVGAGGEFTEDNANLWWDESIQSLTVGSPTSVLNGLPENKFNVNGDFGDALAADFLAISVHNSSEYGSSDFIVSNDADDGGVLTGIYGDFGVAGSNYINTGDNFTKPNDVYLYSSFGAGDLNISALGVGKTIRFATAGDTVDEIRASIADNRFTIYANKDVEEAPALEAADWTAAGGWSAGSGTLTLVSDAGPNTIEPTTPITVTPGVTYRIVIEATGTVGNVSYTLGGETSPLLVDGTNTAFITATTSANLVIIGDASAEVVISFVSVRALVADTGDLFIEGNLKFGSAVQTTTGANIFFSDGAGQATFAQFPIGPSSFPMTDYELANKAYVDANIAGALPLPSSQLATTGNITLVGEQTIDGTMTSASIVLVKDQTLPATNGIYLTGAGAWTRVSYYDATAEVKIGTFTFITGGSTNIGKTFSQYLFNPATDTINVDPIGFTQTSVAPTYTASNGVQLVANDFSAKLSSTGGVVLTGVGSDELSVSTDNSSIELAANALRVKALGVTNAMLAGSITDSKITSLAWSKITSTPTTLSGYGITDAYPLVGNPSGFLTSLAGAVTSVGGTSNRITSSGGATPAIDIAPTYVGQTSITTLGTVGTGVWNATTIGVPKGGTGLTTLTTNNLLVGAGTSSPTFIAPGTANNVLQSNGTTFVSQAMNFAGLVEEIAFQDSNSSIIAQTYTLSLYAEYGFTINLLKIASQSGTCTAAIQINGTNVTGISAVAVSSTIATGTATAANTVVAGNKVTLVITSPSSLVNLQASVKITRT